MNGKMKALVKKLPQKGIWMEEAEIPEIGINDVLIKIKRTAICGTDIHIYEWDGWAQKNIALPLTIGHEFVGVVAKTGSNVHSVKPGDLVSGEGHLVCGVCRNCLAGRRHLCPNTKGVGVNRAGAYAEYLAIPVSNVWLCDPSIDERLYSFFDPFGNAVHTALAFDVLAEDVLITGAGPIGIMAGAVVMHAGARHVAITDINPYRLELARKMGIKNVYNAKDTPVAKIQKELGMKEGFDVGLEMSGNGAAFNEMIGNMAHGGKIAVLGMQSPGTIIDWDKVIFNSITLQGIYGREMYETWYKMTSMLQSGLNILPVLTHEFPVANFEEAFEVMASGNAGKVILNW
jgi:threonine 3-dehydrogenase